jgi:DNA transformation protein and related proteins
MKKGSKLRTLRVSKGFRTFVLDQLEPFGEVAPRDMFGGVGLYCRGMFFGILAADVLYLKVDETNKSDFERAGSKPFTPFADRSGTMQYWAVPLGVLESPPELVEWARKAVAVAERTPRKKTRPAKKKTAAKRR